MITIYKKKTSKNDMEIIEVNDAFFNKYTVELLDENAKDVISRIDKSEMVSKYSIKSRFDEGILNIDKLSTGCKTVLNVMYSPDKIFDIRECGDNALDVLYELPQGNIICAYPLISFEFEKARICDKKGTREITSYDELKEWWSDED